MDKWQQLSEPWQACFEMAWDAFLAGTIPVGAALSGPSGAIVARGRNRILDAPGQRLAGSRLAHAEVDVLAQLSSSSRYRDHVLYSTLEPCLLCVGATLYSTVGRIEYAAADPFGGACTGTIDTAHWRRSAPEIGEPLGGWPGSVSTVLQSAFWITPARQRSWMRSERRHALLGPISWASSTFHVALRTRYRGSPP